MLKNISKKTRSELTVFSLNIRSLTKNITRLTDNIEQYKSFDVIMLNETNCDPESLFGGVDALRLPGFHVPILQKPSRESNRGGGIAIYLNEHLCGSDNYSIINEISSNDNYSNGEFLFVKIATPMDFNKPIILGAMYRSPSASPRNFIECLKGKFQFLNKHKNKLTVLAGDTNVDLLHYETDSYAQELA